MFESYQEIIQQRRKLSLLRERELITLAQKGSSKAQEELLFHLIGFFLYRIKRTLYPSVVKRFGEDLLQDCLVLALKNIQSYDLKYRNRNGILQPLHLSTYMWKGITGLMFSQVKKRKEVCCADLPEWKAASYQ